MRQQHAAVPALPRAGEGPEAERSERAHVAHFVAGSPPPAEKNVCDIGSSLAFSGLPDAWAFSGTLLVVPRTLRSASVSLEYTCMCERGPRSPRVQMAMLTPARSPLPRMQKAQGARHRDIHVHHCDHMRLLPVPAACEDQVHRDRDALFRHKTDAFQYHCQGMF